MSKIKIDEKIRQAGGDVLQEAYEQFVQEGIAHWHKERAKREKREQKRKEKEAEKSAESAGV